ncbi:MAG TPA: hypothetical protein VMY38_06605, partial [Gemmatimonadaceae bacterium]|nr:hypothetical protein [Gemmatimonadaceae bacterium]
MNRAVFVALAFLACSPPDDTVTETGGQRPLPHDVHSYAQPDTARVTHVSLDLAPDFAAKQLRGAARLTIQRAAGADSVRLDVRDLTIRKVTSARGETLAFNTGATKEFLGAPLSIALPARDSSA